MVLSLEAEAARCSLQITLLGQILWRRFLTQVNHKVDCDFVSFKCHRHSTSKSALS